MSNPQIMDPFQGEITSVSVGIIDNGLVASSANPISFTIKTRLHATLQISSQHKINEPDMVGS